MAKDGTNRGGRRVRAGAKPDPLNEKLTAGRPTRRLEDPLNEPFDFEGSDIGDGALLAGEIMPEPSDYLSEVQRDGKWGCAQVVDGLFMRLLSRPLGVVRIRWGICRPGWCGCGGGCRSLRSRWRPRCRPGRGW